MERLRRPGPEESPISSAARTPPLRVTLTQRQIWTIFAGLMLGSFLGSLDQTVVATALPTIVRDLGTASQLSWVVTGYLLASTVATGLWGKLSDLYGRKPAYLTCTAIFLLGSALSGLSQSMLQLILFRALQGIGGGGLIVLAQTIIGDIVSPRDRGKYQGIFGAVFGVSSVVGPFVGGFLVDNYSWRWVFYVNLPVGLLSLLVTAFALPVTSEIRRARVDWLGAGLLALATTALVLLTSLGGSVFPWSSPEIIGFGVLTVLATIAFVMVEQRADEPILTPRLFKNSVFVVSAALSFVIGAITLGTLSYLPSFLQNVKSASATQSGLDMLPLMIGLLLTSMASGQIVSRTGRYKALPVLSFAVTSVGLFLMAEMGVETSISVIAGYLFVFGFGLGLGMQVLTVAVQNVVGVRDLGAATSGVSFFRSIGSVIGVAAFGAVYAGTLEAELGTGTSMPQAYADALHSVFVGVLPFALVAFVLSWFLREVPLRSTSAEVDSGETLGVPLSRSSEQELARALTRLVSRERPIETYARLARRAEVPLSPGAAWLIARIGSMTPDERAEEYHHLPGGMRTDVLHWRDELLAAGYLESVGPATLSSGGLEAARRLADARRAALGELTADWPPDEQATLARLLDRLADALQGREPEDQIKPLTAAA